MVSDIAGCDALDVTWARFVWILSHYPMLKRIKTGKGLDHGDLIALQKESDGNHAGHTADGNVGSDDAKQDTFGNRGNDGGNRRLGD